VKSRFASRSSVIVIALATMSHWSELSDRPLCSPSNPESLTSSSSSSPEAISFMRSMSKPVYSPPSCTSNGG
jgi:hypothetical protein